MPYTVYDMKMFYQSRAGRLVGRMLADYVARFWSDAKGLKLLGYGYATPLLKAFEGRDARASVLMPHTLGVHHWPEGMPGRAALCAESEWPLETESIDRLLIFHGLEHADVPEAVLQEAWRVLKSNGRMLLIVPHRRGLWARADWTPFGHGTPFTSGQIRNLLQASLFVQERNERALFMPPFHSFLALRSAYQFESFGRFLFPGLSGVYIVEASKQVYGGITAQTAKARQPRRMVVVDPLAG
jgi:SAM-dependent methyltransferase